VIVYELKTESTNEPTAVTFGENVAINGVPGLFAKREGLVIAESPPKFVGTTNKSREVPIVELNVTPAGIVALCTELNVWKV
jgi:hypothetical protein